MRRRFFALSLAALLLACAWAGASAAPADDERAVRAVLADAEAGKIISTDGRTLMQAYRSDEAAADQKYRGKTLLVETSIDLVSRDMFGALVVFLKSGAFMPIAARFDKKVTVVEGLEKDPKATGAALKLRQLSAEDAAALLKRGQPMRLVCKGDGYNLGSPELALCNLISL